MKLDDYFNNGKVEMARFGTHTVMKNNMSSKEHEKFLNKLKIRYSKLEKKINRLVATIRKKLLNVTQFNYYLFLLICF